MRLWKGSLVALMVALIVAVMPVGAATTPPPTLTGEVLNGSNVIGEPFFHCTSYLVGTATYTVKGTATGPYSGPFTEHITITVNGHSSPTLVRRFDATFTITAPNGTVTGTKSSVGFVNGVCSPAGLSSHESYFINGYGNHAYTATIATPHGMYRDEGAGTFQTGADVNKRVTPAVETARVNETFQSRLSRTILIAPTSKEQCKDGGYTDFGTLFKNQGQCIKYVNEHS